MIEIASVIVTATGVLIEIEKETECEMTGNDLVNLCATMIDLETGSEVGIEILITTERMTTGGMTGTLRRAVTTNVTILAECQLNRQGSTPVTEKVVVATSMSVGMPADRVAVKSRPVPRMAHEIHWTREARVNIESRWRNAASMPMTKTPIMLTPIITEVLIRILKQTPEVSVVGVRPIPAPRTTTTAAVIRGQSTPTLTDPHRRMTKPHAHLTTMAHHRSLILLQIDPSVRTLNIGATHQAILRPLHQTITSLIISWTTNDPAMMATRRRCLLPLRPAGQVWDSL